MEVNSFYSITDAREHLVRDGLEHIAQYGNRQVLAKDLYLVALLTRNIGDINKGYVHTDISYVLGLLTIDEAVAVTIAKVAVQTISIANRYGSDDGVAIELALATIAHRLALGHIAHLQDGGLKGAYGVENAVVARINTIEAEA